MDLILPQSQHLFKLTYKEQHRRQSLMIAVFGWSEMSVIVLLVL